MSASFRVFLSPDSVPVSPPGTALVVNMIQAEDPLLMLMISVTGVDFSQGSALTSHTHTHTHALDEHISPGQRPGMTHFDYSVLKQQVMQGECGGG